MKTRGTSPAGDWRVWAAPVAAGAAALAAGLHLTREGNIELLLVALDRIHTLWWAVFAAACAVSGGMGILRLLGWEGEGPGERFAFAAGLGLGTVSLGVLGLGMAGLMQRWVLAGALLAFGASGWPAARQWTNDAATAWANRRRGFTWTKAVWAILALAVALNAVRAFEPPWEYDSLEYHLGAPARWDRAGRITHLEDNVYSNMPLNAEMLFLLGMRLRGGPVEGAQTGMLFNALMGLAGALALRAVLAKHHGRVAGDIGAAIYLAWPGATLYAGTGHNEIALQLYGILALCAFVEFVAAGVRQEGTRHLLLSAIMAGFAVGTKYTGVLFVLIPLAAGAALVAWLRESESREAAIAAMLSTAVALAVAGPWLARNAVNTGNPTYPLLYGVFGGGDWTEEDHARWQSRHRPGPMTPAALYRSARRFLTGPEDLTDSALLFAFLPLLALTDRKRLPLALGLSGYVLFCLLGWFLFTHRVDRFMAPAVPALAALGGVGIGNLATERGRGLATAAVLALAVAGPGAWRRYLWFERALCPALGESPASFFEHKAPQFRIGFQAMEFMNDPENVPPDSTVYLFPEARTFWLRRDAIAPTPFDRSPMEELAAQAQSPVELALGLRALGATHLLVNYAEAARLHRTGDFEHEGQTFAHRLDGFDWEMFGDFLARYADRIGAFGPEAERPTIEVYRLRQVLRPVR